MRGWYFQSHRHSLAAQGIKTSLRAKKLNMAQGFFTQAYTSGARKGAEKFEQKHALPVTKAFSVEQLEPIGGVSMGLTDAELMKLEAKKESSYGVRGKSTFESQQDELNRMKVRELKRQIELERERGIQNPGVEYEVSTDEMTENPIYGEDKINALVELKKEELKRKEEDLDILEPELFNKSNSRYVSSRKRSIPVYSASYGVEK